MANPSELKLGRREREIVEALYRLEEASVADVLAALAAPPSYSAVRAMLNLLVEKRVVTFRRDGKRYLYRPVRAKDKVRRSALRDLVRNFFGGQAAEAMAALVDGSAGRISADDLKRMREMIEQAEQDQGSPGEEP